MIDFNRPAMVGRELEYIKDAVHRGALCGDGYYSARCSEWMRERYHTSYAMLTTSCTHALEMAAFLVDLQPGDEVIMPSFTFVSTADAFVLRGARVIFADIRPDTMNLDERRLEEAITSRTRAIVPVHYAGVACEMDTILALAAEYGLKVVEDAAQGVESTYKGRALGTMGDFGCFSFHETKNFTMGEGGALLFQQKQLLARAEILREKGTDRSRFFRGEVDKYRWVDYGSSYLPSELNAAYLYAQLQEHTKITKKRMAIWNYYHTELAELAVRERLVQPFVPEECTHNAHMYYIRVRDNQERQSLISWLKQRGIHSVFHYVPLHTSPAGRRFGTFSGEDRYTTRESERLLRLPMYYDLSLEEAAKVVEAIHDFFAVDRREA